MAYEQRRGQANLFANKKKQDNPKQPDLKGEVEVLVGNLIATMEIAAWRRKSDKAGEYLAIAVNVKHVRPNEDIDRAMPWEP